AKEALKGEDTEAIKSAVEKLATESQAIGQALYANTESDAAAAGATDGAAGTATDGQATDGDVVDAEIVDEDAKQ
ncbi:MAG: molecular chaperone DnaK, partial [Sciscionella sp.]